MLCRRVRSSAGVVRFAYGGYEREEESAVDVFSFSLLFLFLDEFCAEDEAEDVFSSVDEAGWRESRVATEVSERSGFTTLALKNPDFFATHSAK